MRYLLAVLCLCGSVAGYAEEDTKPEEVVVQDDESNSSEEVATAGTDSYSEAKGCGCGGKPKI